MNKSHYLALSFLCALSVANIYYNQPLLGLFAKDFNIEAEKAGSIAMIVQLSYAAGLVLFVPLGDRMVRRKLLYIILSINALSSLLASQSQNIEQLLLINILIGMTSVSAQIVIPMVSLIAPEEQRGKAVGIVVSGLMTGVLFGRFLSGFVGEYLGWRSMYIIAVGLDLILIITLPKLLPYNQPSEKTISYFALFKTLFKYIVSERQLRIACYSGALMFAAFSSLWGGLAFLMAQPPYYFGSDSVGSLGLTGIAGILATSLIGKLADIYSPRFVVLIGVIFSALGFVILFFSTYHILILILGAIFLDIAGRTALIGNQLRALSLSESSRSRLNTIFMCSYFIGGAIGTRMGSEISVHYGWFGISVLGLTLAAIVALINLFGSKQPVT
ncbi:MAG: MFS transporter [Enterobacteriaceae bacterium]|jgi:predicted MFS family arabinose efflux permease|nr:MFS transporter [Enterobacteriaceae bacterium]